MLFRDAQINFTLRPRHLLASPFAVLAAIGLLNLPWSAESAPAWVQAVGSIGAIVAALIISSRQHAAAVARAAAERADKESGLSKRLVFFALELEQVVSSVVLDKWSIDISDADKRVASILEKMLNRINSVFDDDLSSERVGLLFEFRMAISGLIFTLNGTSILDPSTRDESVAKYKRTVKGLLDRCASHAKELHLNE